MVVRSDQSVIKHKTKDQKKIVQRNRKSKLRSANLQMND
jgi:hypothetical protein